MSRSYKKTPIIKDGRSGRSGKNMANRKVRNYKWIISNGKAYRKVFESYDVHDNISMTTYAEHKQRFMSDLKAYLNGALQYDPRISHKRWYDDNRWARNFKRK